MKNIKIEFLRFVACILVVVYHFGHLAFVHNITSYHIPFSQYGFIGVYLFFVISGLVISYSIRKRTPLQFVKNRVVRLYPLYWLSVIFSAAIIYPLTGQVVSAYDFFSNMTMLQKVFGAPDLDGVYWTLFVELIFYFFMFLLILFKLHKKWIIIVSAILLITSKLFTLPNLLSSILIVNYLPFFMIGVVVSENFRKDIDKKLVLLFFIIFSILEIFNKSTSLSLSHDYSINPYYSVIIFLLLLVFALSKLRMESSAFLNLGSYTYPLYLFHQNLGYYILSIVDITSYERFIFIILMIIFGLIFISSFLVKVELNLSQRLERVLVI